MPNAVEQFIRFGRLSPDGDELSLEQLLEARGLFSPPKGWEAHPGLFDTGLAVTAPKGIAVYGFEEAASEIDQYPTADVTSTGWAPSAGTALWKKLRKPGDDSKFIIAGGGPTAALATVNITTEAAPSSATLKVRYRVTGGATSWTLDLELRASGGSVILTRALSGSSNTAWVDYSSALSAPEYGALDADMEFDLLTTATGAALNSPPASLAATGWGGTLGDITESPADDGDYIESPLLTPSASTSTATLTFTPSDPGIETGNYTVAFRLQASAGMRLVDLEVRSAGILIGSSLAQEIGTTVTAKTVLVAVADVDHESGLTCTVKAYRSTATTTLVTAASDLSNANWTRESGATTNLFSSLGESSSTYIVTKLPSPVPFPVPDAVYTLRTSTYADPGYVEARSLHLKWSRTSSSAVPLTITVTAGTYSYSVSTSVNVSSATSVTFTLPAGTVSTNYYDITFRASLGSGNPGLRIHYVDVEVPVPQTLRLTYARLTGGIAAAMTVSAVYIQHPQSGISTPEWVAVGDGSTIKVSKNGDALANIQTGLAPSTQWRFAISRSDLVMVAQGEDPLIYDGTSTSAITMPDSEQPRFAAFFGQRLVLATTGGRVLYSQYQEPTNFSDEPGGGGAQDVIGARGRCTGLAPLGGRSGLVFFQDNVFRMEFVGSSYIFEFVELGIPGCRYPSSIVSLGGVVYYLSEQGFVATRGGDGDLLSIGDGIDSATSRLVAERPATLAEEDLLFPGSYLAGRIVWRLPELDYGLAYDPQRGSWGAVDFTGLDPVAMASRGYNEGLWVLNSDGRILRASNDVAHPVTVATKYFMMGDGVATVTGLRLVASRDIGQYSWRIFSRQVIADIDDDSADVESLTAAPNANGVCPCRVSGLVFRLELSVNAAEPWSRVTGVYVTYMPGHQARGAK